MRSLVVKNPVWFHNQLSARDISIRELGRRSGMEASTVSRIMRGVSPLNLRIAIELSLALDVSLDEIIFRAGLTPPRS